jgi:aminodeoxychorismate lyase
MTVFLNGKFVPEEKAMVSVLDRGFLYGDGLFEGIVIVGGCPFRWDQHMARLEHGLKFLKMPLPIPTAELRKAAFQLIQRNKMTEAVLRLSISRGITERGYSPKNAVHPAVVMTLHPLPQLDWSKLPRWRVITASFRLPAGDPLSSFKTANKLTQVLARAEADTAGAHEAILLNTRGFLAEGTTSNLFWMQCDTLCTPPLTAGALPGVTRDAVFDLCRQRRIPVKQINARPAVLRSSQGAFLSMSSAGIVEIESLDGSALPRSPIVKELWRDYRKLLTE